MIEPMMELKLGWYYSNIIIVLWAAGIMYRNKLLSADQIEQLKIEVKKILQENMTPFEQKIACDPHLTRSYTFDSLYQFSKHQNECMRKVLDNLSQFTFLVMSNFEMIWQEVHHRQGKLSELRQTFAEATSYIEDLKCENEQIKNRLSEAETYIEWIEQEKQYLDAIYDPAQSMISTASKNSNLNRCVSESSLRWSHSTKKRSVNYEKLKDYIESIKEERNQLEKELINLTKKYEIKQEETKKSNLIIEHLFDMNKKQNIQTIEANNKGFEECRNELVAEQLHRILEKVEVINTSTSLDNHLQNTTGHVEVSELSQYFSAYSPYNDFESKELHRNDSSSTNFVHKQTKDVEIGTESQLFYNPTVETQTQNKENTQKEQPQKNEYKISIRISGLEQRNNDKLNKIIEELQLQQQLSSKLKGKSPPKIQKTLKIPKKNTPPKAPPSFLDYYSKRLVSNRIKKYYFKKPDCPVVHKSIKASS